MSLITGFMPVWFDILCHDADVFDEALMRAYSDSDMPPDVGKAKRCRS